MIPYLEKLNQKDNFVFGENEPGVNSIFGETKPVR